MPEKISRFPHGMNNYENGITDMDITFSIETKEMIIGAVTVSSANSPETGVAGKIFIYKHASPVFIEVNIDESYISYRFDNPAEAARIIAEYAIDILTIDFPGSILNMETSRDIGMIQLPKTINPM